MEELKHFSHQHMLYLVNLQQTHIIQNSSDDDEDEDDDDLKVVVQEKDQQQHGGQCKMCEERIYSFHLCYYKCHECDDDYSLHKFCAELPLILKSHPLHDHPGHELTLSKNFQFADSDPSFTFADRFDSTWNCSICKVEHRMFYNYHCSMCNFTMDIVCATMSQQKMVHPSHPDHQLKRMFKSTFVTCVACGRKHEGTFYRCTICSWFWIHVDCALLPTKLSIQQSTKDRFTHSHLLTLTTSFPYIERKAKFFPRCKVCDGIISSFAWLYKCDKCQYYVHFLCATSPPAGLDKTSKNFNDNDHPNLLHCPFPDESWNLLKHYNLKKEFFVKEKSDDDDKIRRLMIIDHFSHPHPLILFDTQASLCNEPNSSDDDEDEDDDDLKVVVQEKDQQQHGSQCKMCEERIYSFHLCYYKCHQCDDDYSLHKFCAELPLILKSHPLHDHPGHELTLSKNYQFVDSDPSFTFADRFDSTWNCSICKVEHRLFYNYHCSMCKFTMDIVCATMSQQTMKHPSHPDHQLERMFKSTLATCEACLKEHKGTFYHCTICSWFWIHVDCASLPTKLSIQQSTKDSFTHSHLLTLASSFPYMERKAKFFPRCKVCDDLFVESPVWLYKCDKCRYYVHFLCATSPPAGTDKTSLNFNDNDHPNLLHCPFRDERCNLLKHYFYNRKEFFDKELKDDDDDKRRLINHFSHPHPLILVCDESISLHNPMKKIQLLCDGCVRPITSVPFYKCSSTSPQYTNIENSSSSSCGSFVLHEWCAKLPSQVHDHPGHPQHTLLLLPKVSSSNLLNSVFKCQVCQLLSNGFAYGCTKCGYYVDINCSLIPEEITHEAHPNHLLRRIKFSDILSKTPCKACGFLMTSRWGFHCRSCDFYIHIGCALLLPGEVRHKYDTHHPLTLRYSPVENHPQEYFCEICEDGIFSFTINQWFYHCTTCAWSMHAACVPLILQSEQAVYSKYRECVFQFLNVKFGGKVEIQSLHRHSLAFVQGLESHGQCNKCDAQLQYWMIFKCLECPQFAIHYGCMPRS